MNKHITIRIDPEMGYTTTYVAYADADGQIHATVRASKPWWAAKRALKELRRKIDHQQRLH